MQLHAWGGRLWARVSAQIYNEISDFERLADAVARRRTGGAPERPGAPPARNERLPVELELAPAVAQRHEGHDDGGRQGGKRPI